MYDRVILCHMSGTGNSYRVACWFVEAASARGAKVHSEPGCDANPRERTPGPGDLVGLLYPAHGFTAPWNVIKFAARLPRGRGAHAFAACTRGGSKFGRVFLPGMEGTAAYLIALILLLRGYSVRGARGIDMPVNWLAVHPGYSADSARAIAARSRPVALAFFERILEGRRSFRSFIPLAFGILLAKISLMYLLIGRLFLAKLFFASPRCNGCGLCAEACPNHAILMRDSRPYWTFDCESCMRCMAWCPPNAVEAGHSLAVLLAYACAAAGAALAGFLTPVTNPVAHFAVYYAYTVAAVWLTYLVLHSILRYGFVNHLFTYTTFTHLYRRSHEPETRLTDLRAR